MESYQLLKEILIRMYPLTLSALCNDPVIIYMAHLKPGLWFIMNKREHAVARHTPSHDCRRSHMES